MLALLSLPCVHVCCQQQQRGMLLGQLGLARVTSSCALKYFKRARLILHCHACAQELSVWSEDANSRPQPIGPTADIGAAASDVGAAYGDLMKLLEAAQKLRGAHGALMAPGQAGRQLGALMQVCRWGDVPVGL